MIGVVITEAARVDVGFFKNIRLVKGEKVRSVDLPFPLRVIAVAQRTGEKSIDPEKGSSVRARNQQLLPLAFDEKAVAARLPVRERDAEIFR